ATDAEEFILNLKKTPYDQVIKSIEWYRKYDSFLPIEFHLKNIYYNMLFQALTQLSLEDRKKVSQLIRAEVDITNCFTSTAASVYGYDIEFIDSLLIPYPLRLSLKTLGEVIRTNSPQEILGLLGPYSKIAKYLLSRDETAANTESLRLLRRETIRQRIEESMNFSYVMHYIFSSQFECRDLTFITLAVQHNINPADYLSY
ncbi:MAG: V-type ATPase subunit, partial [Candidatus Hermodarchaeota archaeon]